VLDEVAGAADEARVDLAQQLVADDDVDDGSRPGHRNRHGGRGEQRDP
jgi:hypothetical protein